MNAPSPATLPLVILAALVLSSGLEGLGSTVRSAGYLEFSLDPTLDRTTDYTLRVRAANVQRDMYSYQDTDRKSVV